MTLTDWPVYLSDRTFYIRDSAYDSYVLLEAANVPDNYFQHDGTQFILSKQSSIAESSFKLLVCDLQIKNIVSVTSYSVNITIDSYLLNLTMPTNLVIKCKDRSNKTSLYNFTGNSAYITSLHSSTVYEFYPGLKNEFGFYVFGNAFNFQTNNESHIDSHVHGFIEGNVLNISLALNGSGYNVTIDYFFPPFLTFTSDNVPFGFFKINSNQTKYSFPEYFNTNVVVISSITLFLNKRNCLGGFPIEIPIKLSYQNKINEMKAVTMAYQISLPCLENFSKISKDKNALREYYGRGILVNADNSYLYICMNQNVESSKPACFFSNIPGDFMIDLDIRVGCVLGRHLITKELYAIHRNQKLYLYFNTDNKKWLGLTIRQFEKISTNLDNQAMKNFEMDEDQYYTFGVNEWMGNAEGLFYRNNSLSLWTQRVKWNH
ncbi:uncharacterized protein LOC136087618 [Hydra vulgaris]|uniref:Uncharacterized protein LOC136087618 n=1 Tax=Hydra vulgaris TaxID=6087 RepID=A0ABM4CYF5_HYDVU